MATFRCIKCSHQVHISLYRGVSIKEIRHSYCGGKLERISANTGFSFVATDFMSDPVGGDIYHSKSGNFTLQGKKFIQLPI